MLHWQRHCLIKNDQLAGLCVYTVGVPFLHPSVSLPLPISLSLSLFLIPHFCLFHTSFSLVLSLPPSLSPSLSLSVSLFFSSGVEQSFTGTAGAFI